jgi:glycosyltransferase involved in cell wall biosynthesis
MSMVPINVYICGAFSLIRMEANTIVFLSSSHLPLDDRIFYHMATSLSKFYRIVIVTSSENSKRSYRNIEIDCLDGKDMSKREKILFFRERLTVYHPGIIICSEPLPIVAAKKYKSGMQDVIRIIYDVTEWYPSKKNLNGMSLLKKALVACKLSVFNVFASSLADGFLFGEYYKSLPYRWLFPFKKWEMIGYYPDLKYIDYKEPVFTPDKICLGYTGRISNEKGIGHFIEVAKRVKLKRPELEVKLKIIGWFVNSKEKEEFEYLCDMLRDIKVEYLERQDFECFSEKVQDMDLCFDLREADIENRYCLPIKLFYYAACGRPVIYSNLRAISKEIDVKQFGYLVNPKDADFISDHVIQYLNHPDMYYRHSYRARELAMERYNWKMIEPELIKFIGQF